MTIRLGDIVSYRGERWKATKHLQGERTVELTSWGGDKIRIPDTTDDVPIDDHRLVILFNPATDWPFIHAKLRKESAGPLTRVLRAGNDLRPFHDWVPGDLRRPGGPVFFNPDLKLRMSEVLVGVHVDGSRTKITINATFGTISRRKARAADPPKRKGPQSRFDRILQDPFGDDE